MPTDSKFWILTVIILGTFAVLGFWFVPNWTHYYQTPEQRYEYLIESIWCPIWEGETVATSQAEVSRNLRDTIREMVNNGRTNEQIYNYIADNYGSNQVAVPRSSLLQRLSIGLPFMLIGGILVVAMGFAWRWSGRSEDEYSDQDESDSGSPDDEKRRKIDELVSQDGPLE